MAHTMYCSQLLSKKGPFATVWIAAHLQRRLRKKDVAETDIGETVDTILYSDIPIALRISSHLLLGIVRIYSRKVNYLYHDCNQALIQIQKTFYTSAINLPPDAAVAPFRAITLPETFDFDEPDFYVYPEGPSLVGAGEEFEHHVTPRELITLQQSLDDRGIAHSLFTLDVKFMDSSNPYSISGLSAEGVAQKVPIDISPPAAPSGSEEIVQEVMDEDTLPPLPIEDELEFEKSPTKELDMPELQILEEHATAVRREDGIEVMDIEVEQVTERPATMEHVIEHQDIERKAEAELADKIREEDKVPGTTEVPVQAETPDRGPGVDLLGTILGVSKPKVEAAPVPPKQRVRKRQKPAIIDEAIGIASFTIKKQLSSTDDIRRFRRKAPSTEYEIWMAQRANQVHYKFLEPSLPGVSFEVRQLFGNIIKRIQKPDKRLFLDQSQGQVSPEREITEGNGALRPPSHEEVEEAMHEEEVGAGFKRGIEIEALASVKRTIDFEGIQEGVPKEMVVGRAAVDETVHYNAHVSTELPAISEEQRKEHGPPEPESQGLDFLANSVERDEAENGIPMVIDMDSERMGKFLEDRSSALPSRTRAVAKYLSEKFKEQLVEDPNRAPRLSLEKLLQGRTRREAARMFYEVSVLRTQYFIEVQQEEPYADIYLTSTPRLMKESF